jgi:hypothetical protein
MKASKVAVICVAAGSGGQLACSTRMMSHLRCVESKTWSFGLELDSTVC